MFVIVMTLVLVLTAAAYDLKSREIPDWISLVLLGAAALAAGLSVDAMPWSWRVIGLLVGFGLGALLFALGAMGGGDAKLMAAMGAALGVPALLVTLLFSAVAGGVLAGIARFRGRKELAYAPAFAVGLLAFLVTGGGSLGIASG